MKKLLTLLFLILSLTFFGASVYAKESEIEKDNILIIDTFNSETPWSNGLFRGIKAQLKKAGFNINLYVEYLDVSRFPNVTRDTSFRTYLKNKYSDRPLKAIIALNEPSIEFISAHSEIFDDAPHFYVYPNPDFNTEKATAIVKGPNDLIGFFDETVELFKTNKIVIMGAGGYKHTQQMHDIIITKRPSGYKGVEIIDLFDLPIKELIKRTQKLPEDSVVLFIPIFEDQDGYPVIPREIASYLSNLSNVPFVTHWDTVAGPGVAGGYMARAERIGELAADEVLKHLYAYVDPQNATNPQPIFEHIYDAQVLDRLGITFDTDKNITYINEKLSLWDKYKIPILIISSTILGLFLIAVIWIITLRLNVERKTKSLHSLTERLMRKQYELAHEVDVKNRIFSILSHDLRSPLQGMMTSKQIIEEMGERLSHLSLLEIIKTNFQAMDQYSELVQNLLQWSSGQINGYKIDIKPVNLRDLSEKVLAGLETKAISTHITIENQFNDQRVMADVDMLEIVFRNVLSNALKFTPNYGTIKLYCIDEGPSYTIVIEDSGHGIADSLKHSIFELGATKSQRGIRGERGSGMGLPLSYDLIKQNKGLMWFSNDADKGSKLCISLSKAIF